MIEFKKSHDNVIEALNDMLELDEAEGFKKVLKGVFYDWLMNYDSTMEYRSEVTIRFDSLLTFLEKIDQIEASEKELGY